MPANNSLCEHHNRLEGDLQEIKNQAQRNSEALIKGDGRFELFDSQLKNVNKTLREIKDTLTNQRPIITTKAATILASAITGGCGLIAGAIVKVLG